MMASSASLSGQSVTVLTKNNKTRRETAVQGTNDSSIVSKWSTAASGYFNDLFLQHFISKQSRRAPLIHRGYYIRAMAFDRIIQGFFKRFHHTKTQILSLGTGFDSTYFRLKAGNLLENTSFFEIDFPELVKRKRLLIENSAELSSMITKADTAPLSPHIELSCTDYHLLGVDLTQLNTLEAALKMCGVDFECPTLLLSECVMTYMTRRCSTELVKWAADTFEQAIFGMYEQVNPDDAFGLFMQAHFNSIGSPLKCINAFPSLKTQENRFLKAGWSWCEAVDMNTFYYHCIEQEEKRRVENLETFDEYEELNLKYSHYFILTAGTGDKSQSLITDDRIIPKSPQTSTICDMVTVSRLPESEESVRRFGHASSLVHPHYALTSGGFGETDGRHQRLAELTITELTSFKSYHVPCCSSDMQVSRMHHTSVTLSNNTTLLIHGRQSPYFMCNQMLKVNLNISGADGFSHDRHNDNGSHKSPEAGGDGDNKICKEADEVSNSRVETFDTLPSKTDGQDSHCLTQSINFELGSISVEVVDQKGDIPGERWRHAAIAVFINGVEKVFLCGGKTKSGEVLGDSYLLDPISYTWKKCSPVGTRPGPRHSHCLTHLNGKVILTGGLDDRHMPLNHIYNLDLATMTWERVEVSGVLYPRYSHTAHIVEDKLILVGGVNTEPSPPGLAVISLTTYAVQEFAFPTQDKQKLLMLHRHTSVLPPALTGQSGRPLVLLGGGGNCFSFGTHLNRTPVMVDVYSASRALT